MNPVWPLCCLSVSLPVRHPNTASRSSSYADSRAGRRGHCPATASSSGARLAIDRHPRLLRRPPAFEVARRAGGRDILPRRPSAQPPRHDMVKGQVFARPAILARKPVTQEQVEAGEGRMLRRLHILPQRDDAGDRHRPRRRVDLAFVIFDDGDTVEENRLDRGLPRPQAQGIIVERRIIGIQDKRGTAIGMPGEIGMEHGGWTLPIADQMARHCLPQVTSLLHAASRI